VSNVASKVVSPAWLAVCILLAAGSLVAWLAPAAWLDWQPALAAREPWRALSAAWVHWSAWHLGTNLAGLGVVAALGFVARLPAGAAAAWAAAWPLTHLGLLVQPALAHYGGASGVLHAAVAVAAIWIAAEERGRARAIGIAIAAGLVAKILLEEPWAGPLVHPRGADIAVAPIAHASGALAGALCVALVLGWRARTIGR
jgi:rhomboid family GlyGly-CTERM serine protease